MANDIRIVTEHQLREVVTLNLMAVDIIEQAFIALGQGKVVMPPILSMELAEANGEVDVKTAYIPGFDSFAIKVSPGFFNNPVLGLPSLNGLMVLFSAKTGMVEAVFLDNGYLTDIRTAAAGAVAARHLAPEHVTTAGVIGTGVQARQQIQAAHLVRPFKKVLVWGRDIDKAKHCARDIENDLGVDATAVTDTEGVLAESQLVVTTTPSRAPIIQADWLHPNLHITAVGADQAGKNEIDPTALTACDLFVCDSSAQCEVAGELEAAMAQGSWTKAAPPELGQIINGTVAGRRSEADITICDLTGTGAQDTAIACYVKSILGQRGSVIST